MKALNRIFVTGFMALAVTLTQAHAEDAIATELSTSEANDFIGNWKIMTEIMDQPFELFLNIVDVEGKLGATLDMKGNPEARAFTSMLKNEKGVELVGELLFMGSFKIEVSITLEFEDEDALIGIVKNPGGFFESPLKGVPVTEEELSEVQGRRRPPTEASIRIGQKTVRIAFSRLDMDSIEREQFENTKDGDVFQYTLHRAMKIYTEVDLAHGGTTIKKENMAPDYPGVYSVWMKKVGDGWSLVFNSQPDIWGSRHKAEFDVYEVPLTVSKLDGDPSEKYVVGLEKDGDNALLTLNWGDQQWSANFEIIQ
ncbi:MAG: DUF2911 domain-containing protein [Candidatus Hydrogenedentota bacterium]